MFCIKHSFNNTEYKQQKRTKNSNAQKKIVQCTQLTSDQQFKVLNHKIKKVFKKAVESILRCKIQFVPDES